MNANELQHLGADDVLEALHGLLAVANDPSVHQELRARSRLDVSWEEIRLIGLIGQMQPVTIPGAASAFHRPERTVLAMVQQLQLRGLVVRRPDRRDRRVLRVSLTHAGRQADRTRHRVLVDVAVQVLRDWHADEVESLARLLDRYTRGLEHTAGAQR